MKPVTFPCLIQVKVTKEMMAEIKKLARKEESMISTLVRNILAKALKGRK